MQVCSVAAVTCGLAVLDTLRLHTKLSHQAYGLYRINRVCKNLMCAEFIKGVVHHGAAGFKGEALPPKATVEKPAYFIYVFLIFIKRI